jgi:hypothetical protein
MTYTALALVTIVIGLVVHLHGSAFGPVTRDVLGDALWGMMIAWWVGAFTPNSSLLSRSALAYLGCAAVELSQLYQTPALRPMRATMIGHLVLGSGFDLRDLVAYAFGVGAAGVLESVTRLRAAATL